MNYININVSDLIRENLAIKQRQTKFLFYLVSQWVGWIAEVDSGVSLNILVCQLSWHTYFLCLYGWLSNYFNLTIYIDQILIKLLHITQISVTIPFLQSFRERFSFKVCWKALFMKVYRINREDFPICFIVEQFIQ